MRRIFSIAMLIVGTMIGAGFCSGREIVAFFGSGISIAVAPLCAVCIFAVCVLFLFIGSSVAEKSFDKVNRALLGKYHLVADIFLLLNNLIVLSAMIAGFNTLCKPFTHVPVFGMAAAVLCAVIAAKGNKGMLDCNFLVVPFIIVSIAVVCINGLMSGEFAASFGMFRLQVVPVGLVYVSMNMMLASTVLTTLGKLTRRQILLSSLIAAAAVGILLALLITALNCTGNYNAEMPVLEISAGGGKLLYAVLSVVTGISIFTTMLTAVGGLCGYLQDKFAGKAFNAAIVVSAGSALSFFGFVRVVDLFYPLVGLFGMGYIIVCLRYIRKSRLLYCVPVKKRCRRKRTPRKKVPLTI